MRVVVGPVSAKSAVAWLQHARGVLRDLDVVARGECFATPEVLAVFDEYLSAWEWVAAAGDPFLWESDIPTEQVEYHLHAFHQVTDMLARRAEATGERRAPEAGEEFVVALLSGVLSALEAESPSSAAFAQHLGQFWPGRDLSFR